MKIDQQLELCLDLAESAGQISATARVVWSDSTGRVGLQPSSSPQLRAPPSAPVAVPQCHGRSRQRRIFHNITCAAAHCRPPKLFRHAHRCIRCAAWKRSPSAPTSKPFFSLVASRSQSLLRAFLAAAIALAAKDDLADARSEAKIEAGAETKTDVRIMICRASAGPSAPPVGAALQVGSGFSGDCVRSGKFVALRWTPRPDERVDRESCRALGIRSLLARSDLHGRKSDRPARSLFRTPLRV